MHQADGSEPCGPVRFRNFRRTETPAVAETAGFRQMQANGSTSVAPHQRCSRTAWLGAWYECYRAQNEHWITSRMTAGRYSGKYVGRGRDKADTPCLTASDRISTLSSIKVVIGHSKRPVAVHREPPPAMGRSGVQQRHRKRPWCTGWIATGKKHSTLRTAYYESSREGQIGRPDTSGEQNTYEIVESLRCCAGRPN